MQIQTPPLHNPSNCPDRARLMFMEPAARGGSPAPLRSKIDQLFLLWLSLPETEAYVTKLLDDVRAGVPMNMTATTNPVCFFLTNMLLLLATNVHDI
jgi:hypothetical protein